MSDQRLGLRLRAGVRGLRVLALALAQQLAVGQRGRGREAGGHLREARHVLIRAVKEPPRSFTVPSTYALSLLKIY